VTTTVDLREAVIEVMAELLLADYLRDTVATVDSRRGVNRG